VSMAIIALCVWLMDIVRQPPVTAPQPAARGSQTGLIQRLGWLVFASGWLVLYLGTVVTGSGPHSGDENARRNGLDSQLLSHLHASAVYLLLALSLGLLLLAYKARHRELRRAATVLLVIEAAQGTTGFVQYFLGLPEAVVALHLLGAALTSAALASVLVASTRAAARAVPAEAAR
jgi:heme a synthase